MMSTPRILPAVAFRDDDGWWTIQIPELTSPGPNGRAIIATGAATTFRAIDKAARDLAAVWLDIEDEAVIVDVEILIPDDIAKLWKDGTAAEEAARAEQARAVVLRRDAVRALRAQGYPAEAAAAAFRVSRQRIGQLDKAS
jgi:hypothetical protein